MIVINFFIPPLSFMLQLAAAAPGLFMPLFMLLLKIILLKMLVIVVRIKIILRLSPKSFDLINLLVWGE